jgi:hypothetical protein
MGMVVTVKISDRVEIKEVRKAGKAPNTGGLPIADSEFREIMQNAWNIYSK